MYFVNGLSKAILENFICFFASRFYKTAADSSYFRKNYGIKEQIDTITNSYNKWLYLFHISSC